MSFSLTDNVIGMWHSAVALSKLRLYIYGEVDRTDGHRTYIKKGDMLINLLAEHHYNKLSQTTNSKDITTIKLIS